MEKYLFLVQARDTIMLHCLIMHFLLHYGSSGRLQEVENKRKKWPQPLTCTSGGCLQEVQNIVIWLRNFCYVGKLVAVERQSLTRGCRHQRFNYITKTLSLLWPNPPSGVKELRRSITRIVFVLYWILSLFCVCWVVCLALFCSLVFQFESIINLI